MFNATVVAVFYCEISYQLHKCFNFNIFSNSNYYLYEDYLNRYVGSLIYFHSVKIVSVYNVNSGAQAFINAKKHVIFWKQQLLVKNV